MHSCWNTPDLFSPRNHKKTVCCPPKTPYRDMPKCACLPCNHHATAAHMMHMHMHANAPQCQQMYPGSAAAPGLFTTSTKSNFLNPRSCTTTIAGLPRGCAAAHQLCCQQCWSRDQHMPCTHNTQAHSLLPCGLQRVSSCQQHLAVTVTSHQPSMTQFHGMIMG